MLSKLPYIGSTSKAFLAGTGLLIGSSFVGLYLFINRRKRVQLDIYKKDFEADKVYLYQFPSCRTITTISPFALKLETFLRWKEIPYESYRSSRRWSKKGQIPFIELNGEQFYDSNIIMERLRKHFDLPQELNPYETAVSRAIAGMLENQTVQSYFYYRYVEKTKEFLACWEFVGSWYKYFLSLAFKYGFKKALESHGIGRHEVHEIYDFGIKDFQALSDILGDKPYMMGDEMSAIDCYIFGHMCQLLYLPLDYPHRSYVEENCPNLVKLTERIKTRYWSDWDKVCLENYKEQED